MFTASWISINSLHLTTLSQRCVAMWPVLENGLWMMRNSKCCAHSNGESWLAPCCPTALVPQHCRQHQHWAQSWIPEPESSSQEEPYQCTLTPEAVVFVDRKHCAYELSTRTSWVVPSCKSITHTTQVMHALLDWSESGGGYGSFIKSLWWKYSYHLKSLRLYIWLGLYGPLSSYIAGWHHLTPVGSCPHPGVWILTRHPGNFCVH